MGPLGSSPSHSPSWSLARGPLPNHCNTRDCLGIHVTLTEETGVIPRLSHTWTATLVEDMLCYARTGLTKAMVTGPGRAAFFLWEMFFGRGSQSRWIQGCHIHAYGMGRWIGKPANLAADPLTIQEGWWEINQAITKCQIKAMGPGHPCMNLLTPQLFRLDWWGDSPQKDTPGVASSDHKLLPHQPLRGQHHNRHRRDQGLLPPQPPLLSLDHGFENNRSSVLTTSSVSSLLDRSEGSQHPQIGRQQGEATAHMKINLPIFKDEDAKDAVTYQSWRWDLMVYHCVGCQDNTLLLYAIWSLQG